MDRRNKGMLTALGLGVGGWLLYSMFKNTASAATPAGGISAGGVPYTPGALNAAVPGVSFAPSSLQPGILTSTLTAVPAVTSAQVAQAQTFWSTLTPATPPTTGYITFPSGSQVAATLMGSGNTAQDGNGNLYVQWAGQVYQLSNQQDSNGNWAAMAVNTNAAGTPTSSGVLLSSAQPVAAPTSWLGL